MNSTLQRILTGHRPTGPRHIGHLVGTLTNWVKLQNDYECFFLVADLHVLTTDYQHPGQIRANIQEMLADWLAAGIDPQRSRIVLQSAIPEHAQLSLLLSMLVSESRLRRVPTYKEQVKELHMQPTLGFLTYPVLQAADILLYRAGLVPVGEDQLPHLELAREIARRFNQLYSPLFPEPQALLSSVPRLPGIDNRAMHTSYGNAIYLRDTPEETTRKVMAMYTDPTRIHASDPGKVEGNPLFVYLDAFDTDAEKVQAYKERYQLGTVGDVEIKQHLAEVLNRSLAPLRERRNELIQHPDDLEDILLDGTRRSKELAHSTLEETMDRMGLTLRPPEDQFFPPQIPARGIFC
ncbi:tryptophanyl-tRNA synthetase [Longilinea arvoryzae]|uniref:Tryptophan--tRNA ligase n=1 Tax=Longilinea arvoryzae TaxID=360412 RepID=A0A0S7BJM6_9CHLR|nr:tryptophan--tRNA ligase [Longilinea arvoryzae]GAP14081.1 tryptophanyl-tRNA synthetase [Longilinea arvoryzae]